MTVLLGPDGHPISTRDFKKSATKPPLIGEIATPWAGRDRSYIRLGGDHVLQFDTSRLKLSDYRRMLDHYQVNASMSVLKFMMHQLDYKIECDSAKVKKHAEWNLELIWTRLMRAIAQSFWAGYSPCALQWENDIDGKRRVITKVKDLIPEECLVHWKKVPGVAAKGKDGRVQPVPKMNIFDGIDQAGFPTIPVSNSFWYPLLMENSDYYGKKLLKAAFQPWYFSLLIHVYSNRYFERFGEPVPVGRAPFDDVKEINGRTVQGNVLMSEYISYLRSGVAVVLPSDKIQNGTEDSTDYEYSVEYLESAMRGADFERYLSRLDEEISMSMFTPISSMKSTSEGYNSGVSQMQTYYRLLDAISSDIKEYIDKYVLRPMAIHNFGENAKIPTIHFKRAGGIQSETLKAMVVAMISAGKVKPNIEDLGQELGMSLTEIHEMTEPQQTDAVPPEGGKEVDPRKTRPERGTRGKGTDKTRQIAAKMADRVAQQHGSSKHSGPLTLGHQQQVEDVLGDATNDFYADAEAWIGELARVEDGIEAFREAVRTGLDAQLAEAAT